MHPPLHREHPLCEHVVVALEKCHKDNPWKKFVGACDGAKRLLDECFREEKHVARKKNAEEAFKRRAIYAEMKRKAAEEKL